MSSHDTLNSEQLRQIDIFAMGDAIYHLPEQIEEACSIADKFPSLSLSPGNIVVTGMGGSAIGGDILRAIAYNQSKIPITVCREYKLPSFVDKNTLVIVISYSGNTEETLSAYQEAKEKHAVIVSLSAGGKLKQLAISDKKPHLSIPSGLQPRAAIGYTFFPVITFLAKNNIINPVAEDIHETLNILKEARDKWSPTASLSCNLAKSLASKLYGRIPIIYGSTDCYGMVAQRWKCQINENSKTLAFWNKLPEMNHNEIVSFSCKIDTPLYAHCAIIFLRGDEELPPLRKRANLTIELIKEKVTFLEEVWACGKSLLSRIFYLIYLGDFVSFYLAILKGEDPTPVEPIQWLKAKLSTNI